MSSVPESVYWRDRAIEARLMAEQLTDPDARRAVLRVAESYERLARTADARATARKDESPGARGLATNGRRERESNP